MIRSIAIEGFKVLRASVNLGRCTLIRGPVGCGKSTIGDAIQFAALGCVPGKGASLETTAGGVNGSEASVTVTLDDGRNFQRLLSTDGANTMDSRASWMPPKSKARETGEQIRGLFGASAIEAAENLDISALLKVSGPEFAKRVETLLASGGLDAEVRRGKAKDLFAARLDTQRPKVDGLPVDHTPEVTAAAARILPLFLADVDSGIVRALERAAADKNKATADSRDRVAAAAEIEARIAQLRAPADKLEALEADRAAKQTHRDGLAAQIATVERTAADRDALRKVIAHLAGTVATRAAERAAADQAAGAVAGLVATRDAIPPAPPAPVIGPEPEPDPEMSAAAAGRENEADALRKALDALVIPDVDDAYEEIGADRIARERLESAKASPWREVEALLDEIDFRQFDSADDMEHVSPIVDAIRAIAQKHGGNLSAAEAQARDAAGRLAAKQGRIDEQRAARDAATAQRASLVSQIEASVGEASRLRGLIAAKLRTANRARESAHAEAVRQWDVSARAALKARQDIDAQVAKLHEAQTAAARAWERAQAEISAAEARLAGMEAATPLDVEATRIIIATLDGVLASLAARINTQKAAGALRAELAKIRATIEGADAEAMCWGAAAWAASRLRDMDMESRTGPFVDRVRRFLAAAGHVEEPYLECAKGAADVGWITTAGAKVPYAWLSGGQSAIFRAAVAYAIVTLRAPAERVLLLELAETGDGAADSRLLRAAVAVSADVQVVASTCSPSVVAPEGVEIVNMAEIAEAVAS